MDMNSILYRIVMPKFVAGCNVLNGVITKDTAPILYKFVGQPISNLEKWVNKNGGHIESLG